MGCTVVQGFLTLQIFCEDKKEEMKKDNPGVKMPVITKMLAKAWNAATPMTKATYEEQRLVGV